jgi:hypothetical protein
MLWNCSGIDDFEAIGHTGAYAHKLSRDKWTVIAHALAHLSFMNRLNSMLDSEDQPLPPPPPLPQDQDWGGGSKHQHRYAKRADNWGAPRKAQPHEVHTAARAMVINGDAAGEEGESTIFAHAFLDTSVSHERDRSNSIANDGEKILQ